MKKQPKTCISLCNQWLKVKDGKPIILFEKGKAYKYKDLYQNDPQHRNVRRVYTDRAGLWANYHFDSWNGTEVHKEFYDDFTISLAEERKLNLQKINSI